MKTKRLMAYPATLGILLALSACVPLLAHHSFQAQYDETQMVTLVGTVTKVSWKNPHVDVNMDVKDTNGKANWNVEMNSPNALMSQGWKVDSIKRGDEITITGFRARDGSNAIIARKVSLAKH